MSIAQHGSLEALVLKERHMLEIARDPAFYMADVHDLTKDELRWVKWWRRIDQIGNGSAMTATAVWFFDLNHVVASVVALSRRSCKGRANLFTDPSLICLTDQPSSVSPYVRPYDSPCSERTFVKITRLVHYIMAESVDQVSKAYE